MRAQPWAPLRDDLHLNRQMWSTNAEGVLESDLLKGLPWLRHGFGTSLSAHWPGEYTQLKQIHSDIVFLVDRGSGCLGEGDALVTAREGQIIGIRTADCVPILFADAERRAVAAAHAGWRGTVAEIARRTVERMRQEFDPTRGVSTQPSGLRSARVVLRSAPKLPGSLSRISPMPEEQLTSISKRPTCGSC